MAVETPTRSGETTWASNFTIVPSRAHPVGYDSAGDPGSPIPVPTSVSFEAVSANGRYALFNTEANNFTGGYGNPLLIRSELFRVDLQTGDVVCVSSNRNGDVADGPVDTFSATISDDGNYVAFRTKSDNLVAGDHHTAADPLDIYMKNIETGEVRRLTGPNASNAFVDYVAVSKTSSIAVSQLGSITITNYRTEVTQTILNQDDLNKIGSDAQGFAAFKASSSGNAILVEIIHLGSQIQSGSSLYWKDMTTGTLKQVNSGDGGLSRLSEDGHTVAFVRKVDGIDQVYVENMDTEVVRLVSSNPSGLAGDRDSILAGISRDGRYVIFNGGSDNFVRNDDNSGNAAQGYDTFVKDLQTGAVRFLDAGAGQNHLVATRATFGGNAQVIFDTYEALVSADTNTERDFYVRDLSFVDPVPAARQGAQIDVSGLSNDFRGSEQIAALATGKFVVSWTQSPPVDLNADPDASAGTQIKAQLLNADGTKSGAVSTVSTDTAFDQSSASVTGLSGGAFIVTWTAQHSYDGSIPSDVRGQIFKADGSKNGVEIVLARDDRGSSDPLSYHGSAVASLSDGGFLFLSTREGFIHNGTTSSFGQRYNASGQAIGSSVHVGTADGVGTSTSGLAAAGLHDGGYVVAYREVYENASQVDRDGVFAQVFGANGSAAAGPFQVNTTSTGTQDAPAIATLADGTFVIAWNDQSDGTDLARIRAQHFHADGTKVGGEFLVGTSVHKDEAPSVAALADGRFLVSWSQTTNVGGTPQTSVYGQIYNTDGSKSFDPFSLTPADGLNIIGPSATALANGSFVIAGTETDFGGTFDIVAQQFRLADGTDKAPVAVSDQVSLVTGRTLTILPATLLANDSDPEGDKLIITAATQGAHGGTSFDAKTGKITYTAVGGYVGADTFKYTIDDGQGQHTQGTVNVTVNAASINHAPKAPTAALSLSGLENATIHGQLAATDSDADSLTYSLIKPVTGLTLNANGSFDFDPVTAGLQSLAKDQKKTVSFQATASDGFSSSPAFTTNIAITGLNNAPVVHDDVIPLIIANNKPITIPIATLLKNDTDIDVSDVVSAFPITSPEDVYAGFENDPTVYGTIVTDKKGNLVFTPNANALALHGSQTADPAFTYSVRDKLGAASHDAGTVRLILHGPDTAPKVTSGITAGTEDEVIASHVPAGTDAESDPLTYTLAKPLSGLTFNANGTFSYDAHAGGFNSLMNGQKSTVSFQFFASDGFLSSATVNETITIVGANDSPSANSDAVKLSLAGSKPLTIAASTLLANDTDPDKGDVLKIGSVNGTSLHYGSISLSGTNIVFSPGVAAAALHGATPLFDSFTYTINDKAGAASTGTVTLTLTGSNAAPKATAGSVSGDEDHPIAGQVSGSDADGDPRTYALVKSVAGLTFNSDGSFAYDPTAAYDSLLVGQKASLAFQFTASDGVLKSAAAAETINIVGVNDAPTANDDVVSYKSATKAPLKITGVTLTKNDTDPDKGDALSLTAASSAASAYGHVTFGNGSAIYTPDVSVFTINTGAGSTGLTDSFEQTIQDKRGSTSSAHVTVALTGQTVAPNGTATMTTGADDVVIDLDKFANVSAVAANGTVTGLTTIDGFDTVHDHLLTFSSMLTQFAPSQSYDTATTASLGAAAGKAAQAAHVAGSNAVFFDYADSTYLMTSHGSAGTFAKGDGLVKFTGVDLLASGDPDWHTPMPKIA